MTLRTRTQGGFSAGADWAVINGTTWSLGTKYALQVGESKTTTDVVTPNFRQRVERGEIINNPFSSVKVQRSHSLTGPAFKNSSTTWDYAHAYWSVPGVYQYGWGAQFEAEMAEAATEARARVASPDVDGLVEQAEAKETMELFRRRTWDLNRYLEREERYARKKGWLSRLPWHLVLADNWMKYRYGIIPLIRLMHDAIIIGPRIRPRRETARGSGSVGGSAILATVDNADATYREKWVVSKTWSVSTRAGILYEYTHFPNKYGFTLSEIPVAMWNAATLTFVADWWWNVSDFIRALTPKTGVSELAGWSGYHSVVNVTATRVAWGTVSSSLTQTRAPSGSCLTVIEDKVRFNNCPGPTLYAHSGSGKRFITSPRVVDAFALATQRMFGRKL